jgi:REP element-mobilizing transposase RayT
MARKPREDVEDGLYHVFARGNAKQRVFLDDADRLIYLRLLAKVTNQMSWRCLAYGLMENHLHLLIETPLANLSQGMQRLQSRYARDFNDRHRRVGHVFQGRFGAVRVTSDEQLWTVAAYIARNPVAGGLCARAEDWRWGSYAATIGRLPPQPWLDASRLLSLLGTASGDPVARYIELTLET